MVAELAGVLANRAKALAALFLVMPPSPQGELVQLLDEVPALLMDLLDLFLFLAEGRKELVAPLGYLQVEREHPSRMSYNYPWS